MKIAICTDIKEFQENKILDPSWVRQFPGAGWAPKFLEIVRGHGLEVTTGDLALSKVLSGLWKPEDILVIQELDAVHGQKLTQLGAHPAILTGFEVPLYAYTFYDKLNQIANKFRYRILYKGAFKKISTLKGNFEVHFPSFYQKEIPQVKDWSKRDFLVTVVANKYFGVSFPGFNLKSLEQYFYWLADFFQTLKSPTRRLAIKNQLVTKRLEAIEYFGKLNQLKLFGRGWDNLKILPLVWQKRLGKVIQKLKPEPIEDKLKTIANYKFSICFENVSYLGCLTEKIIDCFAAGVIPIYLGAPDITDFIPAEAFIDMRNFKSWKALHEYLVKLNQARATKMISAGRKFLKSPGGARFSYEGMANFLYRLVLASTKSRN